MLKTISCAAVAGLVLLACCVAGGADALPKKSGVVYVHGMVEAPGAYSMAAPGMKLLDAIKEAGGLKKEAGGKKDAPVQVSIVRRVNKDLYVNIVFNSLEALKAESDVVLESEDRIAVGSTFPMAEAPPAAKNVE